MEVDPTRVCELLVGLGDVEVVGVDDEAGEPLRVHVRCQASRPDCGACGGRLWSDGEKRWSSWWTSRRSGGRCSWCGTSTAGVARTRNVQHRPPANGIPLSHRLGSGPRHRQVVE